MSSLTGKSLNPVMNRRSVIASAAGLGVAGILAGCSSEGGDSGSASANSNGGEFKIGAIGPKTGAAASYGLSVCNGVELGCKDFSNDTYNFVSKSEDDVADGEKSVTAFNTLADWGMQALVGPVTTGAAVAVSGEIADAFAEQAKASKLDIVDTETFKDDSSTSFINQPTKVMRKIKIEGLTGELTWNDEGQVEKPATAYVIQDGKYIAA